MAAKPEPATRLTIIFSWMRSILGPDVPYFRLAIIYGVAISLLGLATPISVQLLVNSVANTGLPAQLFTLAGILFLLMLMVAGLSAMRFWLLARFERQVFTRLVSEITTRAVHAQNPFFDDAGRADLFNRFFDLAAVQKSVPSLVIGGFTILFQSVVGLVVTSFYHPFFFAFNALLVLSVLLVWAVWTRRATSGAMALCHEKHDTARWLESVGGSNGFYKSSRHLDYAMHRSDRQIAGYIAAHERYFSASFAQTVGFLLIYATATAALLALGGWLILQGNLSIGQLVAAELILSGVFYGISQLGTYLDAFYDLAAGLEEIMMLHDIPQEPVVGNGRHIADASLTFRGVVSDTHRIDFHVSASEQLVAVAEPGVEPVLAMLLKRHLYAEHGLVMVGDADIGELDMYRLRSDITVIDRPTLVEISIRDYLALGSPEAVAGDMLSALHAVGLEARIATLPHGLDTELASSGWPLSIGEAIALKLAAALLSRPRIVVLSTLADLLPEHGLRAGLEWLRAADTTTILVTRHPALIELDGYLWLGREEQRRFVTLKDFTAHVAAVGAMHAHR